MNKYLVRIIALLLVPCLVADPVTAGGLAGIKEFHTPTAIPSSADLFESEALIEALTTSHIFDFVSHTTSIGGSYRQYVHPQKTGQRSHQGLHSGPLSTNPSRGSISLLQLLKLAAALPTVIKFIEYYHQIPKEVWQATFFLGGSYVVLKIFTHFYDKSKNNPKASPKVTRPFIRILLWTSPLLLGGIYFLSNVIFPGNAVESFLSVPVANTIENLKQYLSTDSAKVFGILLGLFGIGAAAIGKLWNRSQHPSPPPLSPAAVTAQQRVDKKPVVSIDLHPQKEGSTPLKEKIFSRLKSFLILAVIVAVGVLGIVGVTHLFSNMPHKTTIILLEAVSGTAVLGVLIYVWLRKSGRFLFSSEKAHMLQDLLQVRERVRLRATDTTVSLTNAFMRMHPYDRGQYKATVNAIDNLLSTRLLDKERLVLERLQKELNSSIEREGVRKNMGTVEMDRAEDRRDEVETELIYERARHQLASPLAFWEDMRKSTEDLQNPLRADLEFITSILAPIEDQNHDLDTLVPRKEEQETPLRWIDKLASVVGRFYPPFRKILLDRFPPKPKQRTPTLPPPVDIEPDPSPWMDLLPEELTQNINKYWPFLSQLFGPTYYSTYMQLWQKEKDKTQSFNPAPDVVTYETLKKVIDLRYHRIRLNYGAETARNWLIALTCKTLKVIEEGGRGKDIEPMELDILLDLLLEMTHGSIRIPQRQLVTTRLTRFIRDQLPNPENQPGDIWVQNLWQSVEVNLVDEGYDATGKLYRVDMKIPFDKVRIEHDPQFTPGPPRFVEDAAKNKKVVINVEPPTTGFWQRLDFKMDPADGKVMWWLRSLSEVQQVTFWDVIKAFFNAFLDIPAKKIEEDVNGRIVVRTVPISTSEWYHKVLRDLSGKVWVRFRDWRSERFPKIYGKKILLPPVKAVNQETLTSLSFQHTSSMQTAQEVGDVPDADISSARLVERAPVVPSGEPSLTHEDSATLNEKKQSPDPANLLKDILIETTEIAKGIQTLSVTVELADGTLGDPFVVTVKTPKKPKESLRRSDIKAIAQKITKLRDKLLESKTAAIIPEGALAAQSEIDRILTANMSTIDAEVFKKSPGTDIATLAISVAVASASAKKLGLGLAAYLHQLYPQASRTTGRGALLTPVLSAREVKAGKGYEQISILVNPEHSYQEQFAIAHAIRGALGKPIEIHTSEAAVQWVVQTIRGTPYELGRDVFLMVDAGADRFYDAVNQRYLFEDKTLTPRKMLENYYEIREFLAGSMGKLGELFYGKIPALMLLRHPLSPEDTWGWSALREEFSYTGQLSLEDRKKVTAQLKEGQFDIQQLGLSAILVGDDLQEKPHMVRLNFSHETTLTGLLEKVADLSQHHVGILLTSDPQETVSRLLPVVVTATKIAGFEEDTFADEAAYSAMDEAAAHLDQNIPLLARIHGLLTEGKTLLNRLEQMKAATVELNPAKSATEYAAKAVSKTSITNMEYNLLRLLKIKEELKDLSTATTTFDPELEDSLSDLMHQIGVAEGHFKVEIERALETESKLTKIRKNVIFRLEKRKGSDPTSPEKENGDGSITPEKARAALAEILQITPGDKKYTALFKAVEKTKRSQKPTKPELPHYLQVLLKQVREEFIRLRDDHDFVDQRTRVANLLADFDSIIATRQSAEELRALWLLSYDIHALTDERYQGLKKHYEQLMEVLDQPGMLDSMVHTDFYKKVHQQVLNTVAALLKVDGHSELVEVTVHALELIAQAEEGLAKEAKNVDQLHQKDTEKEIERLRSFTSLNGLAVTLRNPKTYGLSREASDILASVRFQRVPVEDIYRIVTIPGLKELPQKEQVKTVWKELAKLGIYPKDDSSSNSGVVAALIPLGAVLTPGGLKLMSAVIHALILHLNWGLPALLLTILATVIASWPGWKPKIDKRIRSTREYGTAA